MKQNRRSFLKSSAAATSATVFAGLINTPGVANANTTAPGTTQPSSTAGNFAWFCDRVKVGSGSSIIPGLTGKAAAEAEAATNFSLAAWSAFGAVRGWVLNYNGVSAWSHVVYDPATPTAVAVWNPANSQWECAIIQTDTWGTITNSTTEPPKPDAE